MREPVLGEFGTGPTFDSNPSKRPGIKGVKGERAIALRAELIIKPGNEEKVRETIELILANSFFRDRQFLQALLLVSEMEARLLTVITFWNAEGFAEARERKVALLRKKLQPYLDQAPRVQTFCARVMDGKNHSNMAAMTRASDSFSYSEENFPASVA